MRQPMLLYYPFPRRQRKLPRQPFVAYSSLPAARLLKPTARRVAVLELLDLSPYQRPHILAELVMCNRISVFPHTVRLYSIMTVTPGRSGNINPEKNRKTICHGQGI